MSITKRELEKLYLDTTYSVYIDDKQYDIKIGKPLSQNIKSLVDQENSAVILTAWNPRGQPFPLSENHSRNNQLSSKVIEHTMYKSIGQGDDSSWPAEESFFILGIKRTEADKLAIEFEQYAYVWIERGKQASIIFSKLW